MTPDTLLLIAGLGVAAVVGLVLVDYVIRRADVAAALLLGVIILQIGLPGLRLGVEIGAYVSALDAVGVILVAAAIARLLRLNRVTVAQRLLALLGVLLVASLVQGIGLWGLQTAVVEFRSFLAYFSAALYFATFHGPPESLDRIGRVILIAAVVLCGIVCFRWFGALTGFRPSLLRVEYGAPIRVLDGPQTFFLAQALFLVLPRWADGLATPKQRWLAAGLATIVVLLNRRTAWLTVLVGVGILLWRRKGMGGRARPAMAVVAVIVTAVLLALPEADGSSDVAMSATDTGTLDWRLQGWTSLIVDNGPDGAGQWLLGIPMGSGYDREVLSSRDKVRTVESQPHSFHLQTMLRAGLLGFLALTLLFAVALRQLRPGARRDDLTTGGKTPLVTREQLFVAVVMQVIWFATWQVGLEQGLVTGLAAASWWHTRGEGGATASPGSNDIYQALTVVASGTRSSVERSTLGPSKYAWEGSLGPSPARI